MYLLEECVHKGLVVFVGMGNGLSGHEALDFIGELVNEVLRGEVTHLIAMNVLPSRPLFGDKDHIDLVVYSSLQLLQTPLTVQDIICEHENEVLASRHNLGQIIELRTELIV